MVKNWDIAIASSALLLIVGGIAAPHVRRLIAGRVAPPDVDTRGLSHRHHAVGPREDLPAVV
jgi:hypothetical protein